MGTRLTNDSSRENLEKLPKLSLREDTRDTRSWRPLPGGLSLPGLRLDLFCLVPVSWSWPILLPLQRL